MSELFTISVISHSSRIMLQVILSQPKAEKQPGFRPGRSPVITEKHLQHQFDLFHNFGDFKKAFDSLACRPVAGLQKLQHRVRTGSSHSGTI